MTTKLFTRQIRSLSHPGLLPTAGALLGVDAPSLWDVLTRGTRLTEMLAEVDVGAVELFTTLYPDAAAPEWL